MQRCPVTRSRTGWADARILDRTAGTTAMRRVRGECGPRGAALPRMPRRAEAASAAQVRCVWLLGRIRLRGSGRRAGPRAQVPRAHLAGGGHGRTAGGACSGRAPSRRDRARPGSSGAPPPARRRSCRCVRGGAGAPHRPRAGGLPHAYGGSAAAGRPWPPRTDAWTTRLDRPPAGCRCPAHRAARRRRRHHRRNHPCMCERPRRRRLRRDCRPCIRQNDSSMMAGSTTGVPLTQATKEA